MNAVTEVMDELRRVLNERDEARASLAQIRRVFGNAIAFDDARGDIVKMAEIAYRGACDGDKAVGELRGVTRQRDEARAREAEWAQNSIEWQRNCEEARAELAALRKRVVEALPYPTDDDSDESRTAEEAIEMAVAECDAAYKSRDLAIKMWDEARAEVERLRKAVHTRACRNQSAYNLNCVCGADEHQRDLQKLAYRRGAEAMREACAKRAWDKILDAGKRTENLRKDFTAQAVRDALRALPIPEET